MFPAQLLLCSCVGRLRIPADALSCPGAAGVPCPVLCESLCGRHPARLHCPDVLQPLEKQPFDASTQLSVAGPRKSHGARLEP